MQWRARQCTGDMLGCSPFFSGWLSTTGFDSVIGANVCTDWLSGGRFLQGFKNYWHPGKWLISTGLGGRRHSLVAYLVLQVGSRWAEWKPEILVSTNDAKQPNQPTNQANSLVTISSVDFSSVFLFQRVKNSWIQPEAFLLSSILASSALCSSSESKF